MTTAKIDEAIERYVSERKKSRRNVAETKFLSYSYLACGESDVAAFMRKSRSLIRYYIDFLTVLENPLHGPQAAWLALMAIVFSFGIYMLTNEDMLTAGIFVTSGTVVNGISLYRAVIDKWVETSITIALYRELIELIDNTLPSGVETSLR
ncbi:MAG: hypothetical protein A2076_17495 [Geobacteraceae bacterium GWC2_53_11]|nr:MAG: hypothetical protein A2076_17495 [Geobacteraceae bacterium GWC2_53_11]